MLIGTKSVSIISIGCLISNKPPPHGAHLLLQDRAWKNPRRRKPQSPRWKPRIQPTQPHHLAGFSSFVTLCNICFLTDRTFFDIKPSRLTYPMWVFWPTFNMLMKKVTTGHTWIEKQKREGWGKPVCVCSQKPPFYTACSRRKCCASIMPCSSL